MSARTAESHQRYLDYLADQGDGCPFCTPDAAVLVETTEYHHVIINRFPYAVWDSRAVSEHLMVVPRAHHASLSTMTEDEHRELFTMLRDYEPGGYSIYTRSTGNRSRSQAHIHTHLIKVEEYAEMLPAPPHLRAPERLLLAPDTATA